MTVAANAARMKSRLAAFALGSALLAQAPVGVGVGVAVAAEADSARASAVVSQFFDWYRRSPHVQDRFTQASWNPVKPLFDGELFWMLREERTKDFGKKGYECALDSDPFGLGNGGGKLSRFTVGAPVAHRDVVLVPVRLYETFGKKGRPDTGPGASTGAVLAVKNERGSARIYDVGYQIEAGGKYVFGLRSELARMAKDPVCRWTR